MPQSQHLHYGTHLGFAKGRIKESVDGGASDEGGTRGGGSETWKRGQEPCRRRWVPRSLYPPREPAFDFYVVLDFEATCGSDLTFPLHLQEIIEFPCVLVDARRHPAVIISETQAYVRPVEIPQLTPFCTSLTGITQATVDAGLTFQQAMRANVRWLRSHGLDPNNASNYAVVTCGNWDLESMLPRQIDLIRRRGGRVPPKPPACYRRWINIQESFTACYGRKAGGLKGMLAALDITLSGRHHSGIDDCRNTAKIAMHMLRDGWALNLTAHGFDGARGAVCGVLSAVIAAFVPDPDTGQGPETRPVPSTEPTLARNLGQNPGQNLGQNPGQNPGQNLDQNLSQDLGQNPGQNPRQDFGQNSGQNPRQNPGQTLSDLKYGLRL